MKSTRKIGKLLFIQLLMSLLTILFAFKPACAKKIVIRYGTAAPLSSLHAVFAEKFKTLVEKQTKGEINVEIFLSGTLGTNRALIDMVQTGNLEIATPPSYLLKKIVPMIGILSVPYFHPSLEQLYNNLFMQDISAQLQNNNLRVISWLIGIERVLTSTRLIQRPDEFKGMKIRTPRLLPFIELYKNWGANPVIIPWPEVYTALKAGVVEGGDIALPCVAKTKFFEIQKYLILTNHARPFFPCIISEIFFQKLRSEHQKILIESAKSASKFELQWIKNQKREFLDTSISEGMKVVKPDLSEWIELSKPVQEKIVKLYCVKCAGKWPPECDCDIDRSCTPGCECDPDC